MLAQNPPTPQIGYRLTDISLLDVFLSNLSDELDKETVYGFKFEITNRVDHEANGVMVVVKAMVIRADKEEEIAKVSVGYRYTFANFESLKLTEGQPLPDDLSILLNSVAISTTRGIFYSQTRGTNLQNIIMPLINPADFSQANKTDS